MSLDCRSFFFFYCLGNFTRSCPDETRIPTDTNLVAAHTLRTLGRVL